MNTLEKARVLGEAGKYDVCGGEICKPPTFTPGLQNLPGIIKAKSENGHFCSLLKTLYTNSCKYDCKYCANRAGGSGSGSCQKKIAQYQPEELANLFMTLVQKRIVTGLFLSSGVAGNPDKTTQGMLDTVRIIRQRYNFKGYIHFKVLPGTSYELVKQASELASRMSINVEAPSKARLSELSSVKEMNTDIIKRQSWIKKMNLRSGQTTQMIVGANDETDLEVLKMAKWEYENMNLRRIYYSAFSPVKNTPLENNKAEAKSRSNRLYNTDWLFRIYKYDFKLIREILIDGMLPSKDPKIAIAEKTITEPVDINEAGYEELIRVPGIGHVTAQNIIQMRSEKKEHKLDSKNLASCGVIIRRAAAFIKINNGTQKRLTAFS
ncbi:helix-hairpin-helix domain-containing protein [Candidatus Woesearchaeota archaeon]|nr:helix-hairpin-helix domain-containing protein [Candidatus Woesearchaeota archaeon]